MSTPEHRPIPENTAPLAALQAIESGAWDGYLLRLHVTVEERRASLDRKPETCCGCGCHQESIQPDPCIQAGQCISRPGGSGQEEVAREAAERAAVLSSGCCHGCGHSTDRNPSEGHHVPCFPW